MNPEEAEAAYAAEWPALNAKKEAAVKAGDLAGAKLARQQLSALSNRYRERHAKRQEVPGLVMTADVFYKQFKDALKFLDVPWGQMELVTVTCDGGITFSYDGKSVSLDIPER
jgi:hypothetical protein